MKKLFSLLLVCVLVISCLTGCASTTKVKVTKAGKVTGTTSVDITDDEYSTYCALMFLAASADDEEASDEADEEDDEIYYDEDESEDADEDEDLSEAAFDAFYAECVDNLLADGYEKVTDKKGKVSYRYTEEIDVSNDLTGTIAATYCKIKLSDESKKAMEEYKDYGKITSKLQLTFPYKVKKTNGTLSKNKKTVTWDLNKMKNKTLTAYTVEYKK